MSSNFVPAPVDQFFAFQNDGTVYHKVPSNQDPLQSTTTSSNFLFFRGASVKCLKVVGNITYLLPNCSSDLLQLTYAEKYLMVLYFVESFFCLFF